MARRTHDRAQSSDKLVRGALPRSLGLWQVAVNKTKGLFGQASPRVQLQEASSSQVSEPPRSCRRSISSPSLNPFRGYDQTDYAPAPTHFATQSLSTNLRKNKPSALGRPIISSPSLPQHLDSYDLSNPKLSYPLSPIPSPSGSSFSINSTPFPSNSIPSASDDDTAARSVDIVIDRPARRRTRSAPDVKPISRLAFSPALSTAYEVESFHSSSSTNFVSTGTPDVGTPPSPPPATPEASSDYFSRTLPADQFTSPRSINSVKRKPVPRYLFADPPNHDPSTPTTPLISLPPTPQMSAMAPSTSTTSLHAPLLSESELWTSRMCRKDFALLPIGQGHPQSRPGSSGRTHHRRSISDYAFDSTRHPAAKRTSPAISNITGSAANQLDTPEEEQEIVLPPKGLSPPPPRSQCLPSRPPPQSPDSSITPSHDSPEDRGCSRDGALSPLTDEELQAMRSFVHHVDTGYRARQRRKASRDIRTHTYRRHSRRSGSYEMHVKIFDSYRDDGERLPTQASGNEDVESHLPLSSPVSTACTANSDRAEGLERRDERLFDSGAAGQNEAQSPVEMANRGTFGYYDAPMVRGCRSKRGCNAVYAYAYIPESEVDLQQWRNNCEDYDEDVPEAQDSFDLSDVLACSDSAPFTKDLLVAEELPCVNVDSSSLYGRPSSDFMVYGDDDDDDEMDGKAFLAPRIVASDSESDRPISCYSSSLSEPGSSSASEASVSSIAIGVAIIPPEQLAQLDIYNERSAFSISSCELEEDVDGTPTTVACSSPLQTRLQHDFEIGDLSTSFDRLQTGLARSEEFGDLSGHDALARPSVAPCVLKPALHIESDASISSTEFPSPTETCVASPYQPFSPKSRVGMTTPDWKYSHMETYVGPFCHIGGGGVSESTDDSDVQGSVSSFMHMTPNEPPPKKRSRVRLRQLLSRTNLRLGASRKGSSVALKV